MDAWHYIQTALTGIVAYFLREKHLELKVAQAAHDSLKERVVALEKKDAVNDEANKNRDIKMETIDKKLDRVLEKLGA